MPFSAKYPAYPLPTILTWPDAEVRLRLVASCTCKRAVGEVVPIPTLPLLSMRMASEPAVANTIVPRVAVGALITATASSVENVDAVEISKPRPAVPPNLACSELVAPVTSRLVAGESVPMPTLPDASMRIRSAEFVLS